MDEALINLPENASLKFLMPSRRHHPQVEPLLANYKICYIKRWLNHFWSLQETIFINKKFYLLKTLEGLMPLSKSSLLFTFYTQKFCCFHKWKYCSKGHFPPPSTFKTNLIFTPLFPIKILHFHIFPLSPPSKPLW